MEDDRQSREKSVEELLKRASVTWVVPPLHLISILVCARGYVILRDVFQFEQFTKSSRVQLQD